MYRVTIKMKHYQWIVDVLEDMRVFAENHELEETNVALENAALVIRKEIAVLLVH